MRLFLCEQQPSGSFAHAGKFLVGQHPVDVQQDLGPVFLMNFRQLVHPDDLAMVAEQIRRRLDRGGKAIQYIFKGIKKTGEIVHVTIYGSALVYKERPAVMGTMLDITKDLEIKKRLAQPQRMEAIGNLAAGIAHDFNNI